MSKTAEEMDDAVRELSSQCAKEVVIQQEDSFYMKGEVFPGKNDITSKDWYVIHEGTQFFIAFDKFDITNIIRISRGHFIIQVKI